MWCATIQGSEKRDGQLDGRYETLGSLGASGVPVVGDRIFGKPSPSTPRAHLGMVV